MKSFWGVFFVAQMGPISGWGSNLMLKYMMSFTDLHCKKCCAAFGLVSRSWDPWKFHMALKVWEDVTNVPSWLEGESGGGTMKWNDFSLDFGVAPTSWNGERVFQRRNFEADSELLPQVRPSKRIFGAWCQRSGLGGRPHGSYLRPPVDEAELLLSLFHWKAACERFRLIHQLATKHDSVRFRLYLQELLFRILG